MTKIRVYELAQKMGIENKELMARLKAIGVDVKSHTASIEEADVKNLLAAAPQPAVTPAPPAREVSKEEVRVTTTIIRRRAKVVEPPLRRLHRLRRRRRKPRLFLRRQRKRKRRKLRPHQLSRRLPRRKNRSRPLLPNLLRLPAGKSHGSSVLLPTRRSFSAGSKSRR